MIKLMSREILQMERAQDRLSWLRFRHMVCLIGTGLEDAILDEKTAVAGNCLSQIND